MVNQSIDIVFPIKRIQSNRSDSSFLGSSGGGGDTPPKKDMRQGVLIRYVEVEP